LPTRRRSSLGRSLRDFTSDRDEPNRALRQVEKLRRIKARTGVGLRSRNIVARFRAGQIQPGRSLGIEEFLLTQLR